MNLFELSMDIIEFEAAEKIRWDKWKHNGPQFCCGAVGHFRELPDGSLGGGGIAHRRKNCGREEAILLARRYKDREFALLARKHSRRE